jgi:ATP/ADP translocase/HEAT repeat protein
MTSMRVSRWWLASPLATLLGLRPGEGRRTGLLFVYLLLASSVFILGRTVRDTLFLSRYSLAALPWMFVLYAIASALTVVLYARYADRIARGKLVVITVAIGCASYLAVYALVLVEIDAVYPVFYVWSEVIANLLIVQFWTLANDLHDPRSARRLFPTIGAARVSGVVFIGLVSSVIVRMIGTPQLILVLVALMVVIAVFAVVLGREPRVDVAPPPRRRAPPPRVFGDRYVQVLALFILLTFAALTIGDYQFKAIARESFREDELARFFSLFYAGTGVVALVFQVLITPRLLQRFGVAYGMAVMPAVFGVGAAALLVSPHLAVATVMKFADNGLQYTVHETSVQALYGPFRSEVKARTRAILDALIKPLSYGIGGLALVVLAPVVSVPMLSLASLVLVAGWLAVIPAVRRRHLAALEQTLGARSIEGTEFGWDTHATRGLLRVLEHGRPSAVLAALEQLEGERGTAFVRTLERLAASEVSSVRAGALDRLAKIPESDVSVVLPSLHHPEAFVRAAAVRASAALLADEALEPLLTAREDPAQEVRIAAIAGLLLHCGVEGSIEGGRALAQLLAAQDTDARIEASRVLRQLGPAAYRPVRVLLLDPDAEVRRSALRAAAQVADVRLLPLLLEALRRPATRGRAAAALVAIGAPAIEPLAQALADPAVPRAVRLVLPRIVREIPSRHAYDLLRPLAVARDGHLRLRVLAALAGLRARLGGIRESKDATCELVRFEIISGYANMAASRALRPRFSTVLLAEEFAFRRQRALRRVLRILELRYDRAALRLVRNVIDRGGGRANAIEVLDSLVEPPLRELVLPFFDSGSEAELLERAGTLVPELPTPEDFLVEQIGHPNPYVAALALDALVRGGSPRASEQARRALAHVDPLVREQALRGMAGCGDPEATARAAAMIHDPDRIVARVAQTIAQHKDARMASPLEKIITLKSTPLFSRVAAEDLATLARHAEERSYAAGERIVSEGELGDEFYLLVRGEATVTRGDQQIGKLGPGDAFGELAVLDAGPRNTTVTAVVETEVLAITSEEFYEILYEQAEIAEGVIRMLVKRIREAEGRP